jgi:hypothetical protein
MTSKHRPKVSEPPRANFRQVLRGAALAECLMVVEAWDEFEVLLVCEPSICNEVLRWTMEADDPEYAALAKGQEIARRRLASLSANS